MADIDRLLSALRTSHGLALTFDGLGRCFLRYREDNDILIAQRDEGRSVAFAMPLSHVTTLDPGAFYADLLSLNLSGKLTGPFTLALDAGHERVVLTAIRPVESFDADGFMDFLRMLVNTASALSEVLYTAQGTGLSIWEAAEATAQLDGTQPDDDVAPAGLLYSLA